MNDLTLEAREARNAYNRAWAAANRDKRKAANERYWLRKAQKLLDEQKRQPEGGGDDQ